MRRASWITGVAFANLAAAACTEATSSTDLHTEGPPMIEQVRLIEKVSASAMATVFAFGSHPQATANEAHPVTTASAIGNRLRIIMDELLRGNNLEEISCRGVVDDDSYDRVPLGATPDDIARCSVAQDLLPARCSGSNSHSVCICHNENGCLVDGQPIAVGEPVGVADRDQDGAADNTRFVAGAVAIACGASGEISVPTDLDMSYWTPSGNQQKPAQGGFDALGPAIVLVPQGALPTAVPCGLVFSPDVVDKDGNAVCAPPDGDIASGCAPGDTSAVAFSVEPLRFFGIAINANAQSRTANITVGANVPLDPATVASITVTEDPATAYTDFTATLGTTTDTTDEIAIHWTAAGGLAPATHYTITVPTTVTDAYHQPAPAPFTVGFTTGAN